jgi:hypothetical protein
MAERQSLEGSGGVRQRLVVHRRSSRGGGARPCRRGGGDEARLGWSLASSGRPSLCGRRGGAFLAAAGAGEGGEGRAQSRSPRARSGSPRAYFGPLELGPMRRMRLPGVGDGVADGLGTAGGGWWWLLPLFGLE